ncbi:MAG: NAD(P)/FAD-dependent oxidoreductase [Pseudomonadota bacterium]|nr:NAD(P)/FAD-dependent oxidoreductase [Pseudomonadota bacterium]
MTDATATSPTSTTPLDAIIVGAGFSGMYMLHRLRGLGLASTVIEAAAGVGGTWYWNRYPGARCDIGSVVYSYSFSAELEQDWTWSARYATQPEILLYAEHVADRFDLRRDIRFETRVTEAVFDEAANLWTLTTDRGNCFTARYCIMATGCLSAPRRPDFKGLDSFGGDWYHTGYWPHEGVDFSGKRVGIIGTGSSAIQAIPIIAEQASHLTVFQRTANFSIPAWDGPINEETTREHKTHYKDIRKTARWSNDGDILSVHEKSALDVSPEERESEFERRWNDGAFNFQSTFPDLLTNQQANDYAAEFIREKIRGRVNDPAVAELLSPKNHPFGTKRLCADTDYYETYNRENVTLVDVSNTPIEEITPEGLRTGETAYAFDALVFATGFDAMTGALTDIDIVGRGGFSLREKWTDGPRTYLGLALAGFPNLVAITGPGRPSVLSNMLVSIEQHVDWVVDLIAYLGERQLQTVEPTVAAEDGWVEHVREVGDSTLFPLANSWYMGANIPGKSRVFTPYVGGVGTYRKECDEVVAKAYEGFTIGA